MGRLSTDLHIGNVSDSPTSLDKDIQINLRERHTGFHDNTLDLTLTSNCHLDMFVILTTKDDSENEEEKKCLTIYLRSHPGWHSCKFHTQCLMLVLGTYDVTVLTRNGSLLLNDARPSSDDIPLPSTITRDEFSIRFADQFLWARRRHHRNKNISWKSSGETTLGGSRRGQCPCYTCLTTQHYYDPKAAYLQFSYGLNATKGCCRYCNSLNLALFQYKMVDNAAKCRSLNYTRPVVRKFHLVTEETNVTKSPVEYYNVGTGCYAFRLRSFVNPSPIYHGFFWLESKGEVFNMNGWNTTFYLQPYHDQRSLDVRWTAPSYPYNFSSYDLQVWHHKNFSITCRGKSPGEGHIDLIPEGGKIRLTTTSHSFHNLSSGWYCARVTPIDQRCPPHGCQPRSSLAKLIKDKDDVKMAKIEDNQNLVLATSLLGAVLAVILAGILLACFVLRCRPSQGVLHVAYSKVDHMELLKGVQEVLLVWTAAGIDGPHLAPVVHAFKKLLSSYSLCKVYDYLDITSLPEAQREHLLESPTAWLDSILNQKHIKIIVVGSDGGRRRLMEWSLPGNNGSLSLTNQGLTPHDYLLFPYLLRRLQDRPDLASDYSRVFHIRFSDINDDSAELEGIVSWTRYRIPQHVRALTLALHGLPSNDVGWGLDEPTTEDMVELLTALVKHPGVDITSYTGPWNPIPMNNHVMQIPYTPDNNAKVEDPQPVSNHQQKIDRISQTSSISEELPEKDDSAEYLRENEEKSPSFLNEETINSKNTSMQPPLQQDAKAIRINHSCKEEITKNTCQDISLLLTPPHSDVSSNDDYQTESGYGLGSTKNYVEEKT